MNKAIFSNIIRTPPEPGSKYIYAVDNERLAMQLIAAGRNSVYVAPVDSDVFFSPNSLGECLRSTGLTTYASDYIYVVACQTRKTADRVKDAIASACLSVNDDGWKLFKGRDYLESPEHIDELKNILDQYEGSHTGPPPEDAIKAQFYLFDKSGNPVRLLDKVMVDYLVDKYDLMVYMGSLYIYENGVYIEDQDGTRMKTIIQSLMYKEMTRITAVNNVFALLMIQAAIRVDENRINDYPVSWINFKNGMLDVETLQLKPHDPAYHSINQIPHDYVAGFAAEKWQNTKAFLQFAAPSDQDVAMLMEYLGYCMTTDTRQQVFMMLKGGGGTGKSRVIHLFEYIIGCHNISNVSLQNLNERFYPASLSGKLMNSCADISSAALENVDTIKKITGEDMVVFERKGQDARMFKPYSKLIFSANKLPMNLDEKTNAFYRRMLIFEMNNKPEKADRLLDQKLEAEAEMTINRAVQALHDMYCAEDPVIHKSENSNRLIMDLWKNADSVLSFIEDRCIRDPDGAENRTALFNAYVAYCDDNERTAHRKSQFFQSVQEKGFRMVKRSGDRCFVGLRISYSDVDSIDFEPVPKQEQIPF